MTLRWHSRAEGVPVARPGGAGTVLRSRGTAGTRDVAGGCGLRGRQGPRHLGPGRPTAPSWVAFPRGGVRQCLETLNRHRRVVCSWHPVGREAGAAVKHPTMRRARGSLFGEGSPHMDAEGWEPQLDPWLAAHAVGLFQPERNSVFGCYEHLFALESIREKSRSTRGS